MTGAEPVSARDELSWQADAPREDGGRTLAVFRTHVPADYSFFRGHFRTYPVLAGVVQLHELVLPCLRRVRPELGALASVSGLKFPARIAPGQDVELSLHWEPGALAVSFTLRREGERCTVGQLGFVPEAGS